MNGADQIMQDKQLDHGKFCPMRHGDVVCDCGAVEIDRMEKTLESAHALYYTNVNSFHSPYHAQAKYLFNNGLTIEKKR